MAARDPRELVRAKMPSGGENNVSRSYAEKHGLTILDKPTHRRGRTTPAKPKISLPPAGGVQGNQPNPGTPSESNPGNGGPPTALMS